MVRPPESLAVTLTGFEFWRASCVLTFKIHRREQIASEPRRDKRVRNGRLLFCKVKFPVTGQKFPVLQNIFPVNLSRELFKKWLQHRGFLLRNRASEPQNCNFPC